MKFRSRICPHAYTQVEYLESSGTQYIDTGVVSGVGTEFYIDFELNNTNSSEQIMGKSWLTNNQAISIGYAKNASTTQFLAQAGHTIILNGALNTNRHKASIKINSTSSATFIFDGVPVQSDITYGSGSVQLLLFARQTTTIDDYVSGKLYSSKIIINDTLVRHFIPVVRKIDNVAGMYDLVEGKFYGNLGTGSFIAGPVVITVDKVRMGGSIKGYEFYDYIEGTGTQYIDTDYVPTSTTLKYETHVYTLDMPYTEQDIAGYYTTSCGNVLGFYRNYVFITQKKHQIQEI